LLGASVALSPVSAANCLVDDDAGTQGALCHAIAQANGNFEEDTITIDPSVFFITLLDDGPLFICSTDKITLGAAGSLGDILECCRWLMTRLKSFRFSWIRMSRFVLVTRKSGSMKKNVSEPLHSSFPFIEIAT
jgi:hypothetical protein